jgi:hypothetical protein
MNELALFVGAETSDLFLGDRLIPKTPKLLKLKQIGVRHAMRWNEMWHSRLPITVEGNLLRNTRSVFYGAEYFDHCFASAIWTDPVANNRLSKDFIWLELRRLAIAPDAPKFTATWMIAKMVKDIKKQFPEVTRLVSYQDCDVHTGTIYAAANWKNDNFSKGIDWDLTRKRNKSQSTSPKKRWIYDLKPLVMDKSHCVQQPLGES